MAEYIERGTAIAKLTALEMVKPLSIMPDARRLLADMPAADVAPVVHGRWTDNIGGFFEVSSCSRCGEQCITTGIAANYCPNCGAKMDGGVDND